ncbi:MAG: M23 family metallopeptidase [Woeseiaceae bacterium]|nr:M23 family metallopeptidase [Woeseiaceae bacterium]
MGCWEFVRYGDYIDVAYVSNSLQPVVSSATITIGGEAHRFRIAADGPGPYHAGQLAFPSQSVVTWKFTLFAGIERGAHDDREIYELPFATSEAVRVSQAYDGPRTHRGEHRYAIDFSLPVGTPVQAARAGTVALVVDLPCPDEAGTGCRNVRVDVRHADGSYASYQHLKPGSIAVAEGDGVAVGATLALSGNSGRSRGPHLHFQVYTPTPDGEFIVASLPTAFRTASGVLQLEADRAYTRPVSAASSGAE